MTKRPICATPCNGIYELCEDDIDEQCEGPRLEIVLGLTFIAALIFITIMYSIGIFFDFDGLDVSVRDNRNAALMPAIIEKLIIHKTLWDIDEAVNAATEDYNTNSHHLVKDQYYMETMETNEMAAFFFDCAKNAFTIQITSFLIKYLSWIFNFVKKEFVQKAIITAEHTLFLVIRYSDLAKDLLLLYIIWIRLGNYENGSFPIITFWVLTFSIISSEITNIFMILLKHKCFGYKLQTRVLFMFFILAFPFLPALFIYKCLQQRLLELHDVMLMKEGLDRQRNQTSQELNKVLAKRMETVRHLNFVSANLQATENILENIPQLAIVLMITLLSQTETRTVENIDSLFVNENMYLGYSIMLVTIVNLVRGHLSYLKAYKNGCQMGIFTLIPYFSVGIVSR